MTEKTVQINDKMINIDDILEISEFVNEKQHKVLPYGYSIVLKDDSIINVVCIPQKEQGKSKHEQIFSSYQKIKNYLLKKTIVQEK
jgi:hypothetical protein